MNGIDATLQLWFPVSRPLSPETPKDCCWPRVAPSGIYIAYCIFFVTFACAYLLSDAISRRVSTIYARDLNHQSEFRYNLHLTHPLHQLPRQCRARRNRCFSTATTVVVFTRWYLRSVVQIWDSRARTAWEWQIVISNLPPEAHLIFCLTALKSKRAEWCSRIASNLHCAVVLPCAAATALLDGKSANRVFRHPIDACPTGCLLPFTETRCPESIVARGRGGGADVQTRFVIRTP